MKIRKINASQLEEAQCLKSEANLVMHGDMFSFLLRKTCMGIESKKEWIHVYV